MFSETKEVWNNGLSHAQILDACVGLPPEDDGSPGLYVDREFPFDDPRTMYIHGRPTVPPKPYGDGNVRWLRPHKISIRDKNNNKIQAEAALLDLVRGGAEAGDVIQGDLGDCYLLGAMSSIASKDLLAPLIYPGSNPREDIQKGFVTFMLYKFGEWTEVSVDTLLPCNAEGEPIFAHGVDPNELWVPLLEKAYAKLHGSYEALDGGSVVAALVDLTGGVGESIDFQDDDTVIELADGEMWRRLVRYCKKDVKKLKASSEPSEGGQYLLGAALTDAGVTDEGTSGDMKVTDHGILLNHAYSLVDVAEVGGAGEKLRLVQLRNPWGMREWEGPWGDGQKEWETSLGQKAMQQLNVTFANDGTFWMAWEDFKVQFNKVYVCRIFQTVPYTSLRRGEAPPPGTWCRYEIEGAWTDANSGGCFNFDTWRKNPQYEIRTGEETDCVFLLMQRDPRTDPSKRVPGGGGGGGGVGDAPSARKGGDEGGPAYDHKIGMYVMRGHDVYRRKVLFDSDEMEGDEVVDSTPYMAYREVACNTFDEKDDQPLAAYQPFVLIPSTFLPGGTGAYRIVILTRKPLQQPPEEIPTLTELQVDSAWTELNAGGSRKNHTWRRNEQYHLRLSRPARVSVVLMRFNPDAATSETALHSKKSKAKTKKKRARDPNKLLIGFVVASHEARATRKRLHVEAEEIVDKTLFTPSFEAAAEFFSEEHLLVAPERSYIVVPSTYEPGLDDPSKHADFCLKVYTDDDRAAFGRIEPSTWHHLELSGEWSNHAKTAGGCRNYPSWVLNPLYQLRASRSATCHVFLRQPLREPPGAGELPDYPGVGFYVTLDDGSLSLDDVKAESGFRQAVESHVSFEIDGDTPYLLIPMTYRKGVELPYTIELYCDQPSCRAELMRPEVADSRREEMVRHEAARTITRSLLVHRARRFLLERPPDREGARAFITTWFSKPVRDNDEGYVDINLALNALEAAYIQLTGKLEMKSQFFPQMRQRLQERGHTVADYDVCL